MSAVNTQIVQAIIDRMRMSTVEHAIVRAIEDRLVSYDIDVDVVDDVCHIGCYLYSKRYRYYFLAIWFTHNIMHLAFIREAPGFQTSAFMVDMCDPHAMELIYEIAEAGAAQLLDSNS